MVRFAIVMTLSLGLAAPVMAQDAGSLETPTVEQSALAPSVVAPDRPAGLLLLYTSFGALQVIDAHSTARALKLGAVESNPLLTGIAGNSAGLLAVKAGGAAVAIYATEQLWKRNRAAAIGLMVAANAGMTWVAQHNYRAVR